MAEIISSLAPGQYPTGQTLTVTFPAGTRRAIVTRDDRSPVLSEVLAYDIGPITPNPPWVTGQPGGPGPDVERPFLAVTQDGKGNVVYDGGFPKFYNATMASLAGPPGNQTWVWPDQPWSTWNELSGASKYMVNAFNFCADKRKVAAGNRKVLVIGNTTVAASYPVKGSHYTPAEGQSVSAETAGFMDTFKAIGRVGNWDVSFYDLKDGKGLIDLKYNQLDEYVLIVFLGSAGVDNATSPATISASLPKDLALLRTTGTGIIIITDHTGYNYDNLQDALNRPNGFVRDPNLIVSEYGCYFSGNVDRHPIEVAEIKRQIGAPGPPQSHPLLANLADTDYIFAGASESVVYPELYTNEIVDHTKPLVIPMDTAGVYRVNVLVQLDDGTILTKPMRFVIINPSDLTMTSSLDKVLTANTSTYKKFFDYALQYNIDPTATLRGEIIRNGKPQGYFVRSESKMSYFPFAGENAPFIVEQNDVIGFRVTQPFEYTVTTTVTIPDPFPTYQKSGSVGTFRKALRTVIDYVGKSDTVAFNDAVRTGNFGYIQSAERSLNVQFNWFEQMKRARKPFSNESLAPCVLWLATSQADWETNKPTGYVGVAAIVADTNAVYFYCENCLAWRLHPDKANILFGLNRHVFNTRDEKHYYIGANSTVLMTLINGS